MRSWPISTAARDPAPGHVADREVDDPVRPAQRVVPVAADLEPDAARAVAAGEVDALDRGQRLGQQAALQRDRDLVLLLVAPRAGERAAGVLGLRGDERLVGLVERLARSGSSSVTEPTARPVRVSSGSA